MHTYFTSPTIIRLGLACVFFAASLQAFLVPTEFQQIIANSFVPHVIPIPIPSLVTLVGINDFTVSMLLLFAWRTSRVALYATLWLIAVTLVVGIFSLHALEHLGFLAMAISLL